MRTPLLYSASLCLCLATACSNEPAPPAPAAVPAPAPVAATPPPAAVPREIVFSAPELEQMVAPIALYPDPLLAQVLMASTYPGDVADAVTWSAAHPDAKGDDAVRSVQAQPWDPSVQSLVAFPQALVTLGQDPGWVQRLGDAFLAQPDDVMEAIQRLRAKANAAGNLASNDYMVVRSEPAAPEPAPTDAGYVETAYPEDDGGDTYIIEPASEEVYVPSYDPGVVYGDWAYPAYPPYYYPPPAYYYPFGGALWAGLAFGTGIAIADGLWGDCDWDGGDIDIDVDRYNNINVNNRFDGDGGRWEHNARNRDGVPYRDRGNRERNGQRLDGAQNRDRLRGDEPGRAEARNRGRDADRDRSRDAARDSMARRGMDAPARTHAEARDSARDATAERDRANRDQARRDQDRRDQAGRDQARRDQARRDQAGRDQARRDQGNRDRSRNQANRGGQRSGGDNAFRGASRPDASRGQSSRGRESYGGSQRGGGSRSAGGQANRSPPSRGGGGGRRR